ncbi:4'-phosphopantetheinyl transferase superfamily protein [Streptomyces sp. NBC_01275]|uniref:4'-phosphopantetheinyl transferase family protein n=1 Tax=Streptomyces sp. NBC_01275 TaxID=2903807 RepID=UPI002259E380|nr:4'-phosphopantetheinyl transferase superfamily protein [Streptomyces sp. NBC_01275]MCX4763963.1 4'-phosphopantetheinyl transferase superfamily protein [Streptomyces sp. NBC_01275]
MTAGLAPAREVFLGAPQADSFMAFGRQVDVWVADIGTEPGANRLAAGDLTADSDAELAASIAHPAGRRRFSAGRALARWALAGRLRCRPHEVPIGIGPNGRPMLTLPEPGGSRGGRGAVDFNLSHSGDRVAVVVSQGLRVGIDVERTADRENAASLARRIFSEAELALLAETRPSRYLEQWYRIWTTREAYVKANGTGLSAISSDLPVCGRSWLRHDVRIAGDYTATAVACRRETGATAQP